MLFEFNIYFNLNIFWGDFGIVNHDYDYFLVNHVDEVILKNFLK